MSLSTWSTMQFPGVPLLEKYTYIKFLLCTFCTQNLPLPDKTPFHFKRFYYKCCYSKEYLYKAWGSHLQTIHTSFTFWNWLCSTIYCPDFVFMYLFLEARRVELIHPSQFFATSIVPDPLSKLRYHQQLFQVGCKQVLSSIEECPQLQFKTA